MPIRINFCSMKGRILVTGSSGFVGTNLVRRLKANSYEVFTFDMQDGDIATAEFSYEKLDHVIHLASRTYVPASWENPLDFYRTNASGTTNILDFCRKQGCSLTYVSSYVYGTPQYLPVDENHPVAPVSPYNHSKLVAEDICRFYSEQFGVPVTILRPVNVFGPGQKINFLIPFIIEQVLNPEVNTVEVMDLRPKRDFLYIDDFMDLLISTIGRKSYGLYNVGSGHSVSVEEIIKTVLDVSGIDKPYLAKNIERKNEVWDVYVSIAKATAELGWKPRTTFAEGIEKIINTLR